MKRFMVDDCGTLIDMHTRDTFDYVSDVCDLLNELHEENEQLKQNCKNYRWYKEYKRLLNENKQLKIELEALRKKYNDFSDAVDKRLQEMDRRLLE